ncbi:arylamine N-acetyltransferase family protein [Nocardia callitridis]
MSESIDSAYHWEGGELDLDAYLARIGFSGARTPTLANLRELVYGHTTTFPFENLDIMLGRGIELDLKTLQDKMVRQRRGGYCYENIGLFAAALERFGYDVTGLAGQVVMSTELLLRPRTHALLHVRADDDDRAWLCDVGFGGGPPGPIELVADSGEFAIERWRYRLERTRGRLDSELWLLHQFGRDGWVIRHRFTLDPNYRTDYRVGNHFVSTSPRSPFTTRPFVQRFRPEAHHTLDDTTWTIERPDGTGETHELALDELPRVLTEVFDIDLSEADAAVLVTAPWRRR